MHQVFRGGRCRGAVSGAAASTSPLRGATSRDADRAAAAAAAAARGFTGEVAIETFETLGGVGEVEEPAAGLVARGAQPSSQSGVVAEPDQRVDPWRVRCGIAEEAVDPVVDELVVAPHAARDHDRNAIVHRFQDRDRLQLEPGRRQEDVRLAEQGIDVRAEADEVDEAVDARVERAATVRVQELPASGDDERRVRCALADRGGDAKDQFDILARMHPGRGEDHRTIASGDRRHAFLRARPVVECDAVRHANHLFRIGVAMVQDEPPVRFGQHHDAVGPPSQVSHEAVLVEPAVATGEFRGRRVAEVVHVLDDLRAGQLRRQHPPDVTAEVVGVDDVDAMATDVACEPEHDPERRQALDAMIGLRIAEQRETGAPKARLDLAAHRIRDVRLDPFRVERGREREQVRLRAAEPEVADDVQDADRSIGGATLVPGRRRVPARTRRLRGHDRLRRRHDGRRSDIRGRRFSITAS